MIIKKAVRKLTLETYSELPNKRTGTLINFRITVIKNNYFYFAKLYDFGVQNCFFVRIRNCQFV